LWVLFRPIGRIYRHHGVPITDRKTAERILRKIQGEVSESRSIETVLTR
jgi:hypothetical protein